MTLLEVAKGSRLFLALTWERPVLKIYAGGSR